MTGHEAYNAAVDGSAGLIRTPSTMSSKRGMEQNQVSPSSKKTGQPATDESMKQQALQVVEENLERRRMVSSSRMLRR